MERILRSVRKALALLTVLTLVLLAAPAALADAGGDAGTDEIVISENGTVTLVSGHMAAEKICSVQFKLRVGGEAEFSFAGLGDRLTWCATEADGTLGVYIAGTEPLMGEGVTSVVVGYLTGDVESVEPIPESLAYVYGRRTVAQNAPETVRVDSLWEQLVQVLDSANTEFGTAHKYSDDSWSKLNAAIDQIEQLRERDDLTQQDVDAAIAAYNAAKNSLQLAGKTDLLALLEDAEELQASDFTPDSYALLASAIQEARDAAETEDVERIAVAVQELRAALQGLIELQSADPNGGVYDDPQDPGTDGDEGDGGDDAPDATATPAPTATPDGANGAPNTGDETALLPWAALLVLSAALLAVIARRCRSHS